MVINSFRSSPAVRRLIWQLAVRDRQTRSDVILRAVLQYLKRRKVS